MLQLDSFAGMHISEACRQASEMAQEKQEDVRFVFNETEVIAHPGEAPESLQERWEKDFEAAAKAWRESPEYKEREARQAEELKQRTSASMKESATSEADMRAAEVPWPCTKEQLVEYVESLVNRSHDYGTCVYAMSMAAVAAFQYVAHMLGTTGFQSSCADLDILRRTRSIKAPFMLVKAEDALYPQHDLHEKLDKFLADNKSWLRDEAKKNLADKSYACIDVIKHWEHLARE